MPTQNEVDGPEQGAASARLTGEAQLQGDKRGLRHSLVSTMKRWLREPLLLFLALGAAMFVVYGALNPGSGRPEGSKRIDLTTDDLRQLEIAFAAQWNRPPTPEEAAGLVDIRVREEVLYREALALGLDKEDTIVKRRMVQKMEFLSEDLANAREPTTEELKAWFQKNSQRFALEPRATFRHLYFSPDARGRNVREDAAQALQKLAGEPEDSPAAAALADRFMFQDYYGDRSPEQLAKEFGQKFARALFQLKPGSWQGPIESGFGWHLLWIDSVTPSRVPAFEEVETDVRDAWTQDWHEEVQREAYDTMRAQYQVVLPKSVPKNVAHLAPPPVPAPVNEVQ
jgi:peptidyl-prolyl cis-trans isomerase C